MLNTPKILSNVSSAKMKLNYFTKSFWFKIAVYWLGITLLVYLFHIQENYVRTGNVDWQSIFYTIIELSIKWALLIPLIVFLTHKFSFFGKHIIRNLIIHLLFAVLFAFLIDFSYSLSHFDGLWKYIWNVGYFKVPFYVYFSYASGHHILVYGMTVFIISSINYLQQVKEKIHEASQLQVQLAQAQLHALKMQLNPHFLFNTLHAVSTLIGSDTKAAQGMMDRLRKLLKQTLDFNDINIVPLREELRTISLYLEIEQVRFQDRLKVTVDAENNTLDALIPHFIIQPFVENAIKHGIAPFSASGNLEIISRKVNHHLVIKIQDDGTGIDEEIFAEKRKGIGLVNSEQRLKTLYKDDYKLILKNNEKGGLTVSIEIPFQLSTGY